MHRHFFAVYHPRLPIWHFFNDAHRLFVERRISTFYHLHMANRAISVDDKTTHHTPLYLIFISVIRILARIVDIINQPSLITRESRLHIDEILFIDINIIIVRLTRGTKIYPRHLCCYRRRNHHAKHEKK